jgi:hypothetical protein
MVAAIVKLHGFRFTLAAGPGCMAEIACLSLPGTATRGFREAPAKYTANSGQQ